MFFFTKYFEGHREIIKSIDDGDNLFIASDSQLV